MIRGQDIWPLKVEGPISTHVPISTRYFLYLYKYLANIKIVRIVAAECVSDLQPN